MPALQAQPQHSPHPYLCARLSSLKNRVFHCLVPLIPYLSPPFSLPPLAYLLHPVSIVPDETQFTIMMFSPHFPIVASARAGSLFSLFWSAFQLTTLLCSL